jgi:type I restriction enzyme M protein
MPKSFLDTTTYQPARTILFRDGFLEAVINLHKDTFQPHTGVRTSLLIVRKAIAREDTTTDYPIFMGVSRSIGQDSEGVPIYKTDDQGKQLDDLITTWEACWRRI